MTTAPLQTLCWPLSRLGEALECLGQRAGLSPRKAVPLSPPEGLLAGSEELRRWVEASAFYLGIEAQSINAPYNEVEALLMRGGPALLRLPGEGEPCFLALLKGGKSQAKILAPDLEVHRVALSQLRDALVAPLEAPLAPSLDAILQNTGVAPSRQRMVRSTILRERLSQARVGDVWLIRLPPGSSFLRQLQQVRAGRYVFLLLFGHLAQYVLFLTSWWLVGRGVLEGRLEPGWLIAWGLILLTLLPFRLLSSWAQGKLSLGVGALLKQRLLGGALRLNPEEIRSQGAGQLLGYINESEAVEALALSGGFTGLLSLVDLLVAAWVLSAGAGGLLHVFSLVFWIALAFLYGWRYLGHRRRWTDVRVDMTNSVVEKMVGHRTRLVQEAPLRWHDGEDQMMENYFHVSRAFDRVALFGSAFLARGWIVVGVLGLALSFLIGGGSTAELIVGLGGIFLASGALNKLVIGLSSIAGAWIAWNKISPLFHAASRPELIGSPAFAVTSLSKSRQDSSRIVVDARELVFRYRDRGEPVLRKVNLKIAMGDKLLLEGPSGGGKSTLASLLIGLRVPESGLLLLGGLDRQTLGDEGWRRCVVSSPQFHENHVFAETFAFNLLMGKEWPARPEDLIEAEKLCRELGLGPLLDKMPAGLQQIVGESGWQLSHGEKSRLYLARALLQQADLVVLDESFAALDPETLRKALEIVIDRAPALLVIAHP